MPATRGRLPAQRSRVPALVSDRRAGPRVHGAAPLARGLRLPGVRIERTQGQARPLALRGLPPPVLGDRGHHLRRRQGRSARLAAGLLVCPGGHRRLQRARPPAPVGSREIRDRLGDPPEAAAGDGHAGTRCAEGHRGGGRGLDRRRGGWRREREGALRVGVADRPSKSSPTGGPSCTGRRISTARASSTVTTCLACLP